VPLFKAPVPQALAPPKGGFGRRGSNDEGRLVEGRWRGALMATETKSPGGEAGAFGRTNGASMVVGKRRAKPNARRPEVGLSVFRVAGLHFGDRGAAEYPRDLRTVAGFQVAFCFVR